jgi:ankyrin repeat protein
MPGKLLPPRPDLEQLKRQAKELQHSAGIALHEAQTRLARDYGFASWNKLREEVEARTLEFDAAITQFVEAATDGRRDRAERILALHPKIRTATFHTALVLGDAAAVDARLTKDPALATTTGGPRGWQPIHYLCYTSVGSDGGGLADIARRLIALGVDPNTRFPWLHHNVRRPVLWGASRQAHSLSLVRTLLDAGADPNDGVTLPLAASAGDIPVLEALLAHGAKVDQLWATDGSTALYAILNWSRTADGVRWLLAHGADPNAVFSENGETPLHVAARAWDVPLIEAMVAHGADVTRRRADGRTPYAIAELNGNRAVAEWLLAHGASPELAAVDRLVAACSRGDRAAVDALLAGDPELPSQITDDHYIAFHQAAERGDVRALEAMLAAGFDSNRPDASIGKTALHSAAMEGWPDAVRVLLAHGASVHVRDREFNGQPLVWAAEGFRMGDKKERDFAAVGRLLLDAGSPLEWKAGDEPAEGISEILEAWRRGVSAADSSNQGETC